MSRAWADDSNDVSHLSVSHPEGTWKVCGGGWVDGVVWYRVIIVSALSQRKREERERAWQYFSNVKSILSKWGEPFSLYLIWACLINFQSMKVHQKLFNQKSFVLKMNFKTRERNFWKLAINLYLYCNTLVSKNLA